MAANGVAVPTQIQLSGTGVTQIAGPVYKVTLSLSGTNTVAVTPAAKDIAGSNPSITGTITAASYNTNQATVSTNTVTAVAVGQAVVEWSYPAFDVDGLNALASGKVYAQLLVTVTP